MSNKIYKISQTVNQGYDTFDSAVVIASSEEEAKNILPSVWDESWKDAAYSWASSPKDVKAEYLGETKLPKGLILASFNAG